MYCSINEQQTTYPEGVFVVAGDCNQANMKTVLPQFHQYLDFATRGTNTLDLAYNNIRKAFKAAPRLHLSSSEHLSVMLIPACKPLLITKKPTAKRVRVWPEGALSALKDCFEFTDWAMCKEAATTNQHTDSHSQQHKVSGCADHG